MLDDYLVAVIKPGHYICDNRALIG
jgi:hypothetical protein